MTYYDDISEGYEELHKEEQEKKIEIIKNYLKVDADDKLLDVGCGTGLTTEPWNCEKFGLDPAEKLLDKSRSLRKGITFVKAKAEDIPFKDNHFDIVISVTAIQNFDDIKKGILEIKRVGKDKFVLSFLKRSSKAKEIEKLIRENFKIKKVIEEDKDLIFFT